MKAWRAGYALLERDVMRLSATSFVRRSFSKGEVVRSSVTGCRKRSEPGRMHLLPDCFRDSATVTIRPGGSLSSAPKTDPINPLRWPAGDGATEDHAVAKGVLEQIDAVARGSEIQRNLKAAPYGWPQDAVDAALIALHRSGHIRATRNGQPVPVGALDQAGVKAAEFRPEKIRLTTPQRIALRGLFERAGVSCKSGEEEVRAISFLEAVKSIGQSAAGNAPLPPSS